MAAPSACSRPARGRSRLLLSGFESALANLEPLGRAPGPCRREAVARIGPAARPSGRRAA